MVKRNEEMFNNCCHLCTTALKYTLLCYDEKDYSAIWNALVVCLVTSGLKVYCLCLMSNHIHILLSGTPEQISVFFARFKQKAGRHIKARYGKLTVRELKYELFPVKDRRTFCQEVAYILRNPYKANIESPFSYKWSSAAAYFNPFPRKGTSLSDFTHTDLRTLLKTRAELPSSLRIADGAITPASFVDADFVERMFDHSSILFFNMVKTWNLEDAVNLSHGQSVPDAYTDEEVLQGIRQMCQDVFQVHSVDQLGRKDLARMTRKLKTRFGCQKTQLLRLLPVDDYLLDQVL